jgi:hypothetical protein
MVVDSRVWSKVSHTAHLYFLEVSGEATDGTPETVGGCACPDVKLGHQLCNVQAFHLAVPTAVGLPGSRCHRSPSRRPP